MGWNLSELVAKYDVPGAQVAVLADGEIRDEAAGVLSLHTRVEATTDSVFKIGSITKIWTATLVQQLVNDDAIEKFVAELAGADHPLAPGTIFSYSNSGFVVLGRLVEVLRGRPFRDVLRERLQSCGLKTVAANADEAICTVPRSGT